MINAHRTSAEERTKLGDIKRLEYNINMDFEGVRRGEM